MPEIRSPAGILESNMCPNILRPAFSGRGNTGSNAASDAESADISDDDEGMLLVPARVGAALLFRAVATAEELQEALRAGTNHILVTAHLNAADVVPERDLQVQEALSNAVGRVLNTTLSISVRCPVDMCCHCNAPAYNAYTAQTNSGGRRSDPNV